MSFEQLENIDLISVTFEVLKFDKSNEINDEHPENIYLILVTDEELILGKSNEFSDEHR